MSGIYHWFITSGQSQQSDFVGWYIPEHAQEPLVNLGRDEAFASCHRSLTGGS